MSKGLTMTDAEWWPSGDPVDHLVALLKAVDWRRLRDEHEPLRPHMAHCLREAALWVVQGRMDNPLARGVGSTIEDLVLLNVARAVLAWVQDATNPTRIEHVGAACRACAQFGDLMEDGD